MSEWKNRTTRLVRDGVKVSVMSYPSCFGFADAWQTIFVVHAEKMALHQNVWVAKTSYS